MDILLHERNQLPPDRAGAAKPGYELADRSGQIQMGQSMAKFSGDVFNRIVETRAVNEEHEFYGFANSRIETYQGFVKNNPGASFEDLQKERDKMMTEIRQAGQKATTGIAKKSINNWYKLNEPVIYAKTQTAMEGVVAQQEFDRFQVTEKLLVERGDKNALTDLYAKMSGVKVPQFTSRPTDKGITNADGTVSTHKMASGEIDGRFIAYPTVVENGQGLVELPAGDAVNYAVENKEYLEFDTAEQAEKYAQGSWKQGDNQGARYPVASGGNRLIDPATVALRREAAFAKIDAMQAENWLDSQMTAIATQGGWQASIDWASQPQTAQVLREQFSLNNEQIKSAINNIQERATFQKGKEEKELLLSREKARGLIYDAIDAGSPPKDFDGDMRDYIETQTDLSQDEQQQLWELAVKKNADPDTDLTRKNWDVYWQTLQKVTNDPESIKQGELETLVAKGEKDGISINDYKEFQGILGKNKSSDVLKNDSVINGLKSIYGLRSAGSFVGMKTSEMEVSDKLANEKAWRAVNAEFTRWARANADKVNDPTWDEMVQEKITKLTEPFEQKAQLSTFASIFRPGKYDRAKLEKLRGQQIAKAVGSDIEDSPDWIAKPKEVTADAVSKYYDLANGDQAKVKKLMIADGFVFED